MLLYRVPLWCFTFSCGIHVYGCTVFSISLFLHIHIYSVFTGKLFIYFFLWKSYSLQKGPFSPPDRQLFSWAMAKMTLCLCSQLNLHHLWREHRQMLTLHFCVDSICTGSTFARLFCLPNMRITSHLFIYEGANQLHCDSRAAGSAVGPRGQNLSTTLPHCTHRCISAVHK